MPKPGYAWWHLILSTARSWKHGDPRGFRSRKHRIHSNGDYKNRPPKGEHDGLHRYHQTRSQPTIVLKEPLRETIGRALLEKLTKESINVLCIAVAPTSSHLLVELPNDYDTALKCSYGLKQASSHAVRLELPGKVWAQGGKPIRVKNRDHQQQLYPYILRHRTKEDAWTWAFRPGDVEKYG